MTTAAIYTRLSQDRDGTRTGTDRQEAECRALCRREGMRVDKVYRDRDTSAYSAGPRPDFDAMLSELARFDVVVFWKVDRLTRNTTQFWRVVEAAERAGVRLVSVVDPIDTSTPMGRGVAGMIASMGEQESHNTGTRVAARHKEAAEQGAPHGHRRAFGYDSTGTKVVAKEKRAILEARDRLFAGESMSSICRDWNTRRAPVKPVDAPAWRVSTFKRMITGAKIAGLRQHQGVVVGAGQWPAIVSTDDRERLLAILDNGIHRRRGRPASYLLTGLVTCDRCGATMHRGVGGSERKPKWSCMRVPGGEDRCGSMTISAEHVDRIMEAAILDALSSKRFTRLAAQNRKAKASTKATPSPAATITRLEQQVTQLGVDYDEGLIKRAEWLTRRDKLNAKLTASRAELVPTDTSTALDTFRDASDVRRVWSTLSLDRKRAVARALLSQVRISTPVKRGNTFDPGRIEPRWIV